ncbi:unnamed protein product, partial [Darwinula stevensoni]
VIMMKQQREKPVKVKELIERKKKYKKLREEKLLEKLRKEKAKIEEAPNDTKVDAKMDAKVDAEAKPATKTVSLAVPGSIMDNAQSPELRSYLAGQVARAAAIFRADEVIVYDDLCSGTLREDFIAVKKGVGCIQMARILQYLECPQYLRKYFFPLHDDLGYAGLLNPLDIPHHLRSHEECPFREGIVTTKPTKHGRGSYANIGLKGDIKLDLKLEPGLRVTVKLDEGQDPAADEGNLRGKVVSPQAPKQELGLYWGYTVRLADSLGAVFSQPTFGRSYDLCVGTSERGDSVDDVKVPDFDHLLVVFGGVKGLEAALDADQSLVASDPKDLFDLYLNLCPHQGSRTIRTEEAILVGLSALRPKVYPHLGLLNETQPVVGASVIAMECIYRVSPLRKKRKKCNLLKSWNQGAENVVAFTSSSPDIDSTGCPGSRYNIYVCDINTPWEVHRIVGSEEPITQVEWDLSGARLAVADGKGVIQVWMMKDYVINDWVLMNTFNDMGGEQILCIAWFHNGKKLSSSPEQQEGILYSEKFKPVPFAPTCCQFGKRPMEGLVVASVSGLLATFILRIDASVLSAIEKLGPELHTLAMVDFAYEKNGDMALACVSRSSSACIRMYSLQIRVSGDSMNVTVQNLPAIFPTLHSSYIVSCVQFLLKEDPKGLLIAMHEKTRHSCVMESEVTRWRLSEKLDPVSKHFGGSTSVVCIQTWEKGEHCKLPGEVKEILVPFSTLDNGPPSHIVVSTITGTLHCLSGDSFTKVFSKEHELRGAKDSVEGMELKRLKAELGPVIQSIRFSWSACSFLLLDVNSSLCLYRLVHHNEPGGNLSTAYGVHLLEYSLVMGLDWWDIILSLRPGMAETVCERVADFAAKQPLPLQQYFYTRIMALKMNLYRYVPGGGYRVASCNTLVMLHSVAAAFRSVLRPSELASHDKGPAENLASILAGKMGELGCDLDKVCLQVEAKEFTVEASTLQSLQQLIQWVSDLALFLIATAPTIQQTRGPTYELLRDGNALGTLRELLVIIRLWGLFWQHCMPVFTKALDNLDAISLAYKLLTKISLNPEMDVSLLGMFHSLCVHAARLGAT